MTRRDYRRYGAYLPVVAQKEYAIRRLHRLMGDQWHDRLFVTDSGLCKHLVRGRYGELDEIQIYMKDKTWRGMKVDTWLRLISLPEDAPLPEGVMEFVRRERELLGKTGESGGTVKAKTARQSPSSPMSLMV